MAFIKDPRDIKNGLGGTGGVIAPGQNSGSTPSGDPAQQQSVAWTNLQDYISGNEGLSSGIQSSLLDPSKQANQNFSSAAEGLDSAAASNARMGITNAAGMKFEDPSNANFANFSDQDFKDYQNWKSAPNYTGPSSLQAVSYSEPNPFGQPKGSIYENTVDAGNKYKSEVGRLGSFAGQAGIASQQFGGKSNANYNAGMSMLDTLIANQGQGGAQKIADYQKTNPASIVDNRLAKSGKDFENAKFAAGIRSENEKDRIAQGLQTRYDQTANTDKATLDALERLGVKARDRSIKPDNQASAPGQSNNNGIKVQQEDAGPAPAPGSIAIPTGGYTNAPQGPVTVTEEQNNGIPGVGNVATGTNTMRSSGGGGKANPGTQIAKAAKAWAKKPRIM